MILDNDRDLFIVEKKDEVFPPEKILDTIEQFIVDVRDFFKYLITVAVTVIPLMIGIAGFLLRDQELNGYELGFLITGLILIFITIPINLTLYQPRYKPWSRESFKMTGDLAQQLRDRSKYSIILLVLGMLFAFVGILLIVII